MNRRNFIKAGALGALGVTGQVMGHSERLIMSKATPTEGEGPFYPVVAQKDKDFDLTKITGNEVESLGERIFIRGGVFDTAGNPVEGATVDLW